MKKDEDSMKMVTERMKQLRLAITVHSFLYYRLDQSVISDEQWQEMAQELVSLQQEHPIEASSLNCYDEAFIDFDGSTGYYLPQDDWVVSKAHQLLTWSKRHE